jgi:anti-sigma regulatory factor (Ser/Thr protein kinase)
MISRTCLTELGEAKLVRDTQAPRLARETVTAWVGHSHPARDVLVLAASELVTNAVQHADPGCDRRWVLVHLSQGIDFLRLTVTDPGSLFSAPYRIPARDQFDDKAEGGRGLAIVAELSRGRWGSHLLSPSMHRVVWCDVGVDLSGIGPQRTHFPPLLSSPRP